MNFLFHQPAIVDSNWFSLPSRIPFRLNCSSTKSRDVPRRTSEWRPSCMIRFDVTWVIAYQSCRRHFQYCKVHPVGNSMLTHGFWNSFFLQKSTNHRRVSVDNCWWVISWRSEVIVRHKKNLGKIKNTNVSHSRQACVNYAAQYRRAGKSDETWKFSESIAEISLTRCLHSAYVHSKRLLAEKIVCENLAKIVYVAAEVICT